MKDACPTYKQISSENGACSQSCSRSKVAEAHAKRVEYPPGVLQRQLAEVLPQLRCTLKKYCAALLRVGIPVNMLRRRRSDTLSISSFTS